MEGKKIQLCFWALDVLPDKITLQMKTLDNLAAFIKPFWLPQLSDVICHDTSQVFYEGNTSAMYQKRQKKKANDPNL